MSALLLALNRLHAKSIVEREKAASLSLLLRQTRTLQIENKENCIKIQFWVEYDIFISQLKNVNTMALNSVSLALASLADAAPVIVATICLFRCSLEVKKGK